MLVFFVTFSLICFFYIFRNLSRWYFKRSICTTVLIQVSPCNIINDVCFGASFYRCFFNWTKYRSSSSLLSSSIVVAVDFVSKGNVRWYARDSLFLLHCIIPAKWLCQLSNIFRFDPFYLFRLTSESILSIFLKLMHFFSASRSMGKLMSLNVCKILCQSDWWWSVMIFFNSNLLYVQPITKCLLENSSESMVFENSIEIVYKMSQCKRIQKMKSF